MILKIKNFFY